MPVFFFILLSSNSKSLEYRLLDSLLVELVIKGVFFSILPVLKLTVPVTSFVRVVTILSKICDVFHDDN